MARSKAIEGCSDKILPRFSQFVGTGWSDEILFENHVDSLSTQRLDFCLSLSKSRKGDLQSMKQPLTVNHLQSV